MLLECSTVIRRLVFNPLKQRFFLFYGAVDYSPNYRQVFEL